MYPRVPRLESSFTSIHKLKPLYFVSDNFGEVFTVKGGNLAEHIFVKFSRNFKKKKTKHKKTVLTAKMAVDRC